MLRPALHNLARDLATYVADLALQVAHASLARVSPNDRLQRAVLEDYLLFGEASTLALLADEILFGNLQLLNLGVAMQPQNLHPVLQRSWDCMQHIRPRNE